MRHVTGTRTAQQSFALPLPPLRAFLTSFRLPLTRSAPGGATLRGAFLLWASDALSCQPAAGTIPYPQSRGRPQIHSDSLRFIWEERNAGKRLA